MENYILRFAISLGIFLAFSITLQAQKTWKGLEEASGADALRNGIVARLIELEEIPASDYKDAKMALWKARAESLDHLALFIDDFTEASSLYALVNMDEAVQSFKTTAHLFKEEAQLEGLPLLAQMPEVNQRVTAEIKDSFLPIRAEVEKLSRTQQGGCVHAALDDFYSKNSGVLVKVADDLFPGKGDLKFAEIKEGLKLILEAHLELLSEYTYEGKTVTKEEMLSYIDKVYQNDMPEKLCSYTYNLAIEILSLSSPAREPAFGVHRLFDAIAENYLTGGGCLDGRRNRQFIALTSMLAFLGL